MGGFLGGLALGAAPAVAKYVKGKIKNRKPNSSLSDSPVMGQTTSGAQSAKRGGKIKKTGLLKVHKGERVLTKKQTKRMNMRRSGKER